MTGRVRPLASAAVLLMICGVAACASRASVPAPASLASAPAPTPGYDWILHQDEAEQTLSYGVASSDEMKLQLVCRAGSGALELAASADKPTEALHLESGGDTERYAAVSEPAGIHSGHYVQANASAADPVFQRFRRVGWIALWNGDAREVFAAHPGAQAGIERFFTACG